MSSASTENATLVERRDTYFGEDSQSHSDFKKELESLINRHSMENGSNTPDFILAQYLSDCLRAFNAAMQVRGTWYTVKSK